MLSAETGALTGPPPFTEISDPPEWLPDAAEPPVALPFPDAELPEALPFPELLLSADTGAFAARGTLGRGTRRASRQQAYAESHA